jgi:hypothetical protein
MGPGAPDNGFGESVLFWHIRQGHYGDINLDGLSFVRVGRWEGDLWAGKAKGSAGIFIDDRANERQAGVLPRIFGGHVGGFPALVAALFAEGRQVRGIERARITFEIAPDHLLGLNRHHLVMARASEEVCAAALVLLLIRNQPKAASGSRARMSRL